jgi:dynein intermediate chain
MYIKKKYPELLLASYEDTAVDTDGVALVWNSKFKSTSPEFVFNCSVKQLSKFFH